MHYKFSHKKSIFSVILLMSILSLSGCSRDPEILKDGFFEYIILKPGRYWYNGENESIAIVGFTESGLKQESIKIPKKINDIPVEYLGYSGDNGGISKTYIYYPKVSENDILKNVYFYDNIRYFMTIECEWDVNNSSREFNVFNCSKNIEVTPIFTKSFGFYWYKPENFNSYSKYLLPNIVYSYNMDSENYYFLDNVSNGDILVEPIEPIYDGYTFTGWFSEPECINKYNFQNPINLENDNNLFLYAGWQKNNND